MMMVRDGPATSAVAGPRSLTHIMLKRMCRKLPCSQLAVSTVHPHPKPNPGIPPPHAEDEQPAVAGRENRHHAAADRLQIAARHDQRQHVQRRAGADDEGHEAEIATELPQRRPEAPQPGIRPTARVALADWKSTRLTSSHIP